MNPNFPDGLLDGTSITSLAQLAPHDLSCRRHRQAVDELDGTRILVGGETIAYEGLNFSCQLRLGRNPRARYDEGFDNLAANWVRRANYRDQKHRRVCKNTVLDIGRTDPISTTADEIVLAPLAPEVAAFIFDADPSDGMPTVCRPRRGNVPRFVELGAASVAG
jgi:hypothetical protein